MEDLWTEKQAPHVPESIQERLTELGGRIPDGCGRFSGLPVFKLVWGPDVRVFRHGKKRKRFTARQRRVVRHYALSDNCYAACLRRIGEIQKAKTGAMRQLDLEYAWGSVEGLTPWLTANFSSELDYKVYDPETRPEALIKYPAFPRYFRDVDFLLQVGIPHFYVLRWMPSREMIEKGFTKYPTMIDTRSGWEQLRYGVGYLPETGESRMLDLLGPYPQFGDYEHVFLEIEAGDANETVIPTEKNTIEPLQAYCQLRDAIKTRSREDKEFRLQQDYLSLLADYEREELQWGIETDERFKDARPAFMDAHVTVPAMPPAGEPQIKVVSH